MKSIDDMRNLVREQLGIMCPDEAYKLLDNIGCEVKERYIELPNDADGVTISPSDNMIDSKGRQFVVSSIELLDSGEWLVYGKEKLGNESAKLCHHYKPLTVEDVLEEALNKAANLDRKEGYWPSAADIANIVNEFAPKLQLREE